MNRQLLRTLTRKSILGFGYKDVRDLSVQQILDSGNRKQLLNSYFGLSKINFTEDILEELGIIEEFRIEKPGALPRDGSIEVAVKKVLKRYYDNLPEKQKLGAFNKNNTAKRKRINRDSKSRNHKEQNKRTLERYNHGHR